MKKKIYGDQLEDIIDLQDNSFTLSEVESIAKSVTVLKQYEKDNTGSLYTLLLLSLTHETFSENEARVFWNKIIEHMKNLEDLLDRKVGVTVATLDYLSNITKILNKPIIIEEEKSYFVAQTSTIDELTQLYIRDVFDVTLTKNIDEAKRTNTAICLLLIDIDDFKQVNDKYGHQAGDEVLHDIGTCVNKIVREMDLAARYGGEELAIILPDCNIEQGYITGERIRKDIEKLKFDGFSVTVSIGVSVTDHQIVNFSEVLIKKADEALYKAKKEGKNRTVKQHTIYNI